MHQSHTRIPCTRSFMFLISSSSSPYFYLFFLLLFSSLYPRHTCIHPCWACNRFFFVLYSSLPFGFLLSYQHRVERHITPWQRGDLLSPCILVCFSLTDIFLFRIDQQKRTCVYSSPRCQTPCRTKQPVLLLPLLCIHIKHVYFSLSNVVWWARLSDE